MKNTSVYTFAKWQVKEGELEMVLNLLPEIIKKSSEEKGNLFYKVHQSLSDSHTLLLSEGYADEKALDEHRGSDHFKHIVIKQIVPLLDKREIEITHSILEHN